MSARLRAVLTLLEEMERAARSSMDADAYDFVSCGSGDEISVGEAESAWRRWRLRPRVLVDVAEVSAATTVLGAPVAAPFLVAPTAFHTLAHPEGEVATAAGVAAAGSLMVVSMRSTRRLEDVAAATAGRPWWQQVYLMRDRSLTAGLVDRAAAAGASALVLTADTPVLGTRRRPSGRAALPDEQYLVNLAEHAAPGKDPMAYSAQDPGQTTEAIGWLAGRTGLPVVVKGVLRGDDARRCLDAGAAAVIVSNHGGRQLDLAVPTARALPEVVAAVGDRCEVYVDGGVRDGTSALVALALGARAVLVGRPVYWGLAHGGAAGVAALLEALRLDLGTALALAGAPSADQLPDGLATPA